MVGKGTSIIYNESPHIDVPSKYSLTNRNKKVQCGVLPHRHQAKLMQNQF